MLEGGEEVSVDGWGVFIGGVGSREAKGALPSITPRNASLRTLP